jgi:hypothetical protein
MEMSSLWRQVLDRKYGVVRGEVGDGGRRASKWWNNINSIRRGSFNGIIGWFENSLGRHLYNGEDISFWDDPLVGRRGSLLDRGVQIQTNSNKNRKPIQKNQKPQKTEVFWMCLDVLN